MTESKIVRIPLDGSNEPDNELLVWWTINMIKRKVVESMEGIESRLDDTSYILSLGDRKRHVDYTNVNSAWETRRGSCIEGPAGQGQGL